MQATPATLSIPRPPISSSSAPASSPSRRFRLASVLVAGGVLVFASPAPAQTTAPAGADADATMTASSNVATSPDPDDEETFILAPFTVTANKDVGFVASNALAGGRIATPLKDTPVAYSVVTSELMEALNLTDVVEAAAWTVNSSRDAADNTGAAFGTTSAGQLKLRGTSIGTPTRNFFPYVITPDSYNLDRVDFARGPNAVLFGAGGVGGTLNSVTKQALPGTELRSVRLQVGSYNKVRLSADLNQPFLDGKAALRVNLLSEQADTWRDNEWTERNGVSVAMAFKITPQLSARIEGEYGTRKEARSTTSIRDNLSAWDGVTVFSGVPATAPNQATRAAAGINGPNTMRWVTQRDFPADTLLNFQNLYVTKAAVQNGTLANTNLINGVPIRTVGFNLTNSAMVDDNAGIPDDRWANALRGSPFFKVPTRETTTLWSSKVPTYEEVGKDIAAYLNYQLGDNLFIELAGDINEGDKTGNTAARRGLMDLYIDINQTLPNGTANPNFLHPYTEFMEYRNIRNDSIKNVRAQAVYMAETKFGKLNFSLMGGVNREENYSRARTLLLPLSSARVGSGTSTQTYTNLDARTWVDNDEYSQFGVYTRMYLDQANRNYSEPDGGSFTILNPASGQTETVTPKWMYDTRRVDNNRDSIREYEFFQVAGNFDLFNNKLILIGAFRRDFTSTLDKRVVQPGDEAVGWDGSSVTFRQAAPDDYFDLTYLPKNSAGVVTGTELVASVRPRTRVNGVNVAQPQYAADRFQDDFDSPELTPIVNTYTVGGVFNATPWLGLYGNVSQTFSLTSPQLRADLTLNPPTASQGYDYGIRFTLPDGRLAVSIGGYSSYQENESVNMDFTFKDDYNRIYAAPVVGDLSPGGRNQRDMAALPDNVYSTRTRDVSGYEADITANLTRDWRLIMNAGYVDAIQRDSFPDILVYFEEKDEVSRLILDDAGVVIDANNDASIRPELDNPALINEARVDAAVAGWNHLQDILIPNITTAAGAEQEIIGNSRWVGNIATDYRLRSGPLKGLRIGAGANYRGPMVIAYRGSDTIDDPNNPGVAIDDPSVDATTSVETPSYVKMVASFSYTWKLKDGRSLQFDLNIDNLLDSDDKIYTTSFSGQANSFVRAREGGISSPARITVPGAFSYVPPRTFSLSTKFTF